MICIYCKGDTRVGNSRLQRRSNNIWRRRVCKLCAASFTTLEKPDLFSCFMVHGKDATLEKFSRDKLFLSIHKSCQHRKGAIADASALTDTVIAVLPFPATESIDAKIIATNTHQILKRFDEVAASLYEAYHLQADTTS